MSDRMGVRPESIAVREQIAAEIRQRLVAMTCDELLDAAVGAAEALDSLRGSMASDPRDFGEERGDAWCYGIVFGWGEEEAEDGLPLVESIGRRFGWEPYHIARQRRLSAAVERVASVR